MTDGMEAQALTIETAAALAAQGIEYGWPYRLTLRRVDGFEWQVACRRAEDIAGMIQEMNFPEITMYADADHEHALREVDAVLAALRSMFKTLH